VDARSTPRSRGVSGIRIHPCSASGGRARTASDSTPSIGKPVAAIRSPRQQPTAIRTTGSGVTRAVGRAASVLRGISDATGRATVRTDATSTFAEC
jgi:hypothetical protein